MAGWSPATSASISPPACGCATEHEPAAGSLRAAQYIYSVAPKDGTTFGTFAAPSPPRRC